MPWALAMLPVQRKRHVRLLSNVQPEKRRDVSCWPDPESPILVRQVRSLGPSCRAHGVRETTRLTRLGHLRASNGNVIFGAAKRFEGSGSV